MFNYIHLWPFIESWTNHIWGFWNPWPVWGELSLLHFHFTHVAACEDLYRRSHSALFCYGQQLMTGWIPGLRPQYPLKSLSEDSSCAFKKPCQRRKGEQNGYKILICQVKIFNICKIPNIKIVSASLKTLNNKKSRYICYLKKKKDFF